MLSVMRDPLAAPERRDQMAIASANYVHAKLAVTEQKTETVAEIRVSQAELAERAVREINEAFREWQDPRVIEHQPVRAPDPPSTPEPSKPPRQYARDDPPAVAEGVTHLPTRWRPHRPRGSGWET
jgi:hypothetical protein